MFSVGWRAELLAGAPSRERGAEAHDEVGTSPDTTATPL